jgi:hypothetical protein
LREHWLRNTDLLVKAEDSEMRGHGFNPLTIFKPATMTTTTIPKTVLLTTSTIITRQQQQQNKEILTDLDSDVNNNNIHNKNNNNNNNSSKTQIKSKILTDSVDSDVNSILIDSLFVFPTGRCNVHALEPSNSFKNINIIIIINIIKININNIHKQS